MGTKTKIDWCDATWNPVTGCLHGCEYCYARRIAERFGSNQMPMLPDYPVLYEPVRCTDTYAYMRESGISTGKIQPYPFDFLPTFHRYKLDEPQKWKKPRNIFVCSMADLFGDWVPDEWILEVFKACKAAPQHRYLFLTKNPARYDKLCRYDLPYLDGAMFGYTLDESHTLEWFERENPPHGEDVFVSIEPITEPLNTLSFQHIAKCGWVIVGAETGNRKNKIIPEKKWVDDIASACRETGVPLFMEESLRPIMGDDFRQEFPWEV